jgi:hypothetical protein
MVINCVLVIEENSIIPALEIGCSDEHDKRTKEQSTEMF